MMNSTHETLQEHARIKPASDRAFGVTVGGVLGAIGLYRAVALTDGPGWVAVALPRLQGPVRTRLAPVSP